MTKKNILQLILFFVTTSLVAQEGQIAFEKKKISASRVNTILKIDGVLDEVEWKNAAIAKDFFGFTTTPTKEEIKKRYKELAKIYHPDINNGDDVKMKELNHYRDVLMKTVE